MDCAGSYEISREPEQKVSLENFNLHEIDWLAPLLKTKFKHIVRDRLPSKIFTFEAGPALIIETALIHEMISSSFFYTGKI